MLYWYISLFHKVSHKKKKGLPVNRSLSQPFLSRHPTGRSAAWQDKTAVWGTKSLRAQISWLLCRRERCLPTTELKRRWVTKQKLLHKSARIRLTCRHNNTKLCFYRTKVTRRVKKKITKNNTLASCALQSMFVESYFKEIKTAPKLKTSPIRTGAERPPQSLSGTLNSTRSKHHPSCSHYTFLPITPL